MVFMPDLAESFSDDTYFDARDKPEHLDPQKRILYEIEKLLGMEEKDLEMDVINSRADHKRRIPNRDIYRIYKALLKEKNLTPSVVYTGRSILSFEEFKEMMEESENHEKLSDFEPSL